MSRLKGFLSFLNQPLKHKKFEIYRNVIDKSSHVYELFFHKSVHKAHVFFFSSKPVNQAMLSD